MGAPARALQLFSEHILQHRLVQRQLGYQLLQPRVLVAKLLDLANLIDFQPGILRLPAVVRLLRGPHLSDQLRYQNSHLGLLQHGHNLLYGKLLLHGKILAPSSGQVFAEILTLNLVQF